ncbi:hypothetical protein RUM44_001276 [Polyplax serrata]|uniref:Uncharacterized protein n=1 Tax=Polyplax serrata TaxID=468196 RepID=A0ABR1AJT5_POLSC
MPCAKCRRKSEMKGMKYIQPPVPASFKPEARYKQPAFALESGTIYRLSYPGVEGDTMKECRPKNTPAVDNIRPSSLPISQDTTFRLSFTGVPGEKAVSCKPMYRNMMGAGPLQSMTTQRHDYTMKISERPVPHKQENSIHLSTAKMENGTTMSLSYQPVEGERVTSYKPQGVYKKPEYRLEQDTINRLSYQPWEPLPKEVHPWQKKDSYKQPNFAMENNTIYRGSYMAAENYERMPSFKPQAGIMTMGLDKPLASATIYKESYQDNGQIPRPAPIVKRGNIFLSTQPMSQDTTARLSYTGIEGERAAPYKPILRNMMGAGPMQSMTTQRHDFTPKPIVMAESFRPRNAPATSNFKMEETTTFRASYLPNENIERTQSYKPMASYKKSNFPLESDTINRLSFQPWTPMPKEEFPWTKKPKYEQPTRLMENNSIYRGSYLAPGGYVQDDNAADEGCDCQKQRSATDDL